MSEVDILKLRALVIDEAEGKTSAQAIATIMKKHAKEVAKNADYLIGKALAGLISDARRRRATKPLNDGFDLFGEYPVRRMRVIPRIDETGKSVRMNIPLENATIGEVRAEIERLSQRALPKQRELNALRSMVERAEKHGDDTTEIGLALTIAHGDD